MMTKLQFYVKIGFILFFIALYACQDSGNNSQSILNSNPVALGELEEGFRNPPSFAKPRVFWWWLNSMATRKSITRDLEELKDKGFGGALIFDAGSSSYKVAHRTEAGPVFGSLAWKELFAFAVQEADRLGLELSLNIQSGWNPGGPTVNPKNAMKKIVWTEKSYQGPVEVSEQLPQAEGEFYHDIALLAYRQKDSSSVRPIKHWGYKSLNQQFRGGGAYPLYKLRDQEIEDDYDLKSDSIIDLSDQMDKNGSLQWNVPEGEWVILRFGYVLTGAKVSTSSDGYSGLSFNHLSSEALDTFFNNVVDPILANSGIKNAKSLKYLHTDSWEMGLTNWTENFFEDFQDFRGYNMRPYLPVLAGKIVDSREISNRFLYDFRKTVSDCIADRMYKHFAKLAHDRGFWIHPESGGPHSAPIDGLKCLGRNDIPMGEFWARANTHRVSEDERLFIKQSSSAAHIYGKRFVAGEGPTTIGPQWERSPKDLKNVFDRNFCEGINRFFWHCFTSSPEEFGLPGNEYFAGTHLNPNTTWWKQCTGFIDYLARSSYLLSQGLFQADVCFYYADDVPNFVLRKHTIACLGPGYDYDECNAEVIVNRMSVKDKFIVLPDGMHYRILGLPDREAITLKVLEKIEKLVKAGATVVGPKPLKSTGLNGYPDSDAKLKKIADRLWGACDGEHVTVNYYGHGRVFWGKSIREILAEDGIVPDFTYTSSQDSAQLDYIHRKTDDIDIYFVVNRLARFGIYDTKYRNLPDLPDRYEWVDCSFRVSGKAPEIWDPMTGSMDELNVYQEKNGTTLLPLHLEPEGSRFVVFRKRATEKSIKSIEKDSSIIFPISISTQAEEHPPIRVLKKQKKLISHVFKSGYYTLTRSDGKSVSVQIDKLPGEVNVNGEWDIYFPPGWGAPEKIKIQELKSWTESIDPCIRYFSGTAEYRKEVPIPKAVMYGNRLYLDLGNVLELAEVIVNGKSLGVLWMPPFTVDITEAVHIGNNDFIIRVVNLWPNRLIGDQFLPIDKRFTKTNIHKFKKSDPLRISGLLGPVRIFPAKIVALDF